MKFDAIIDAAAAAEGIPAPLLRAIGVAESGMNPGVGASRVAPAAGGERGVGMMQLTPSTAKAMGVDPNDPTAAVYGAAKYLRQGLDQTGNLDDAVRFYHAGPDRRQWGPRTEAYHGKVSAALSTAGLSGVPAGGAASPAGVGEPQIVDDDHDNAFTRGLRGQDASVSPPPGGAGNPAAGDNFFSRGLRAATAGAYDRNAPTAPGPDHGVARDPEGRGPGVAGAGPADRGAGLRSGRDPSQSAGGGLGGALHDVGAGLATGAIATPAASIENGLAWTAGKLGATDLQQRWQAEAADLMDRAHDLPYDHDGTAYRVGDLGGEIAATLPLGEVSILSKIPMIARAADARKAALAADTAATGGARAVAAAGRLGDYAVQGGLAGAALSAGSDAPFARQVATGALMAPAAGAAFEKVAPIAATITDGAASRAQRLAAALRDAIPGGGQPPVSDEAVAMANGLRRAAGMPPGAPAGTASVERTADGGLIFLDAKGNALGGTRPDGSPRLVVDIHGDVPAQTIRRGNQPETAAPSEPDASAAGMQAGSTDAIASATRSAPTPPGASSPADAAAGGIDIASALGSRGAKSGLEANDDLPPEVLEHAQRLIAEGVPADHALREADITFVGAKPTIAAVTRDPMHQQAVNEGAKLVQTPEGRALNAQVAGNNAAVTAAMQRLVADQGGVPAAGEAARTAAQALADASDQAATKTRMLYGMARRLDGDATISIDPLRELLATPEFKAPVQPASREFVSGLGRLADELSATNRNRFSADDVEKLRQAANAAYDPMGGQVNAFVGRVKGALDQSMDQFEQAGPSYRGAREAHRAWASAYDDPAGIAGLIRRDAAGMFTHEDDWRKAEGALVGGISDKAFAQVVRQLKADGGKTALRRLRASILQRAYEAASTGAADAQGNAVISGQRFFAALNKVGTAKLGAIFSRDELARIAATGRAAIHLNEPVPGTLNTSSTAATLGSDVGGRMMAGLAKGGGAKAPGVGVHVASSVGGGLATVLGHTVAGPVVGAGVSGVKLVADAMAKRGAERATREAIRDAMDPAMARAAARATAKRQADIVRRRAAAQRGASRAAPIAGGEERDAG